MKLKQIRNVYRSKRIALKIEKLHLQQLVVLFRVVDGETDFHIKRPLSLGSESIRFKSERRGANEGRPNYVMVVRLANDELKWMECQDLPLLLDRQTTRVVDFERNIAARDAVQSSHYEFLAAENWSVI